MRENELYWIDENNNKWSKNSNTKEQAETKSKSLKNCSNCSGCSGCSDCSDCSDCSYCSDCSDCSDCSHCSYCSDCSDCSYCSDCSHCSHCSYCSDCSDCSHCSYCSDFKENPQRIYSPKIGSRKDTTKIYWTNKNNIQIKCGCFKGSIKQFTTAIAKIHGENEFGKEYIEWLNKVKVYIGV